MVAPQLVGVTLLTLGAGVVLAGAVQTPLTLLERTLLAVVTGIIASSALTYAVSIAAGLSSATVLGGPSIVILTAVAARVFKRDALRSWRLSFAGARAFWRGDPSRAWGAVALSVVAMAIVAVIFARTLYSDSGALASGYTTVWADWSQHLTTASSFAVAQNDGFTNPLFSGTALIYPFLPDFHSATLMTLGASPAAALALPSALLVLVIGMLVVCVARRLGVGPWGGIVA
ncbi:MAG: hypothetical protein ABR498_01430, partial [Candidatus Dormibacteria bacterium]